MPTRMIRGNGERLVPDEKVAEYLAMGYSVIDSKGNVVRNPDTNNPTELKKQIETLVLQRDAARLDLNNATEYAAKIEEEAKALKAAYDELMLAHQELSEKLRAIEEQGSNTENAAITPSTPLEASESSDSTNNTPKPKKATRGNSVS